MKVVRSCHLPLRPKHNYAVQIIIHWPRHIEPWSMRKTTDNLPLATTNTEDNGLPSFWCGINMADHIFEYFEDQDEKT